MYVLVDRETCLFLTVNGDFGCLEDARLFTPLAAAAIAWVYGDEYTLLRVVGPTGHPAAGTYPSLS